MGRNGITWEEKIDYDLKYIENITFWGDFKIVFMTVWTAFVKGDGVSQEGMDTAEDLGDYLLNSEKISREEYTQKQEQALSLLM